jgi:ribosome-associated toxin RatA of RatAB toxin-antitoxin module
MAFFFAAPSAQPGVPVMTRVRGTGVVLAAVVAAALVFAPLGGRPAAAEDAHGPALSAKVLAGEIESSQHPHREAGVNWGRAVVLLDVPIEEVTAVVQDYGGYKNFMPHFEVSRVLSRRGASALIYVQARVMHGALGIWAELKLSAKTNSATRVIEAKMTRGNVDRFLASWELTPLDAKRTLVAFQILVDPDLPVPSSFIGKENQTAARKVLRALRKLLVEGKPAR